jgi:hypothetical protein
METLDAQFRYTVVFSVGLTGVLGILQWEDAGHGALFFASTMDGFSLMESFLHRYFPTIMVVLYGMAFSWIDLDIKDPNHGFSWRETEALRQRNRCSCNT